MKFKSMFCALAVAALAPVFADQTSSNICGWVQISSDLDAVIIGVPWVEVNSGTAVKVANLVKTDNLTDGDKLYYYQGGTWNCWQLTSGAWQAVTTVENSKITISAAAADQAIARGQALILERSNKAVPFFVFGQYTADAAAAQTVTAGTAAAPTYTLLASPKVEAFDLNGTGKIANVGATDEIVVPKNGGDQTIYKYKDNQWGYWGTESMTIGTLQVQKQVWKAAPTIPAGTGFWYVSRGGAATFNW